MPRRTKCLLVVAAVLGLLGAGWFGLSTTGHQATPRATRASLSDESVVVDSKAWLTFEPAEVDARASLVLYPGGRVDPYAYAPLAREIALQGYRVVIVPMPLGLAALAPNQAGDVIAAFPDETNWAIAGHALGGTMAARYASRHPDKVQGLVLWASYPASGDDLSSRDLSAVSVYGTRDGLVSPKDVEDSRDRMPARTLWIGVSGGNHAGFGDYGPQQRDNSATITIEQQQDQIVSATTIVLQMISQTDDDCLP